MNISEIIKKTREEKGLTVEELSSQTMLSVAIIKDLENGDFDHYQVYLTTNSSILQLL